MKKFRVLLIALTLVAGCTHAKPTPTTAGDRTPASAKAQLVEGNKRFMSGHLLHPRQSIERRDEVAKGQKPMAVILACSDSRTPPEVLFDQGLGDLFVVRVAGNVADDGGVASIEYAVEQLGAQLIVVLGHKRCGAVSAAKEIIAAKGKAPGHLGSLVDAMRPAVKSTTGKDVEATCIANVEDVVQSLRHSKPILGPRTDEGKIMVVGAYYDLDNGVVWYSDDAKK